MKGVKFSFVFMVLIVVLILLPSIAFAGGKKEETSEVEKEVAAPAPEKEAPAPPKVYKGLILPDGTKMEPMEILTVTPGADPTLNQEAVFLAEWWKKLGIPVKVKAMEKGALTKQIYWTREYDAALWYTGGEKYPMYIQYYFTEAEIYQYGWNLMQYVNPEYDRLSSEWLTMLDSEESKKRADELQRMIAEDNAQIPLISDTNLTAFNNKTWTGWINQHGGIIGYDSMCTIDPAGGDTEENILRIGLLKEPDMFNPLGTAFTETWAVIGKIYNGGMWNQPTALYRYAPVDGGMVPFLADGEIVYDDSVNTAIVNLKKGIKWHDGTELTAKDIKFTVDLIKEFEVPNYKDSVDFIEKVEVLNNYSLKYYLTEKTSGFFQKTMAMIILQENKWSKIADESRGKEEATKYLTQYPIETPMGTGPFKFAEWKKGAYILLEKNQNWFFEGESLPMGSGKLTYDLKVDKILFKLYASSETRIMALKNGDIDICTIPAASKDDFEKNSDMTILEWGNDWVDFIAFNCIKAPFSDPAFRKALNYLIDREFFVEKLQHGYAIPQYTVVPAANEFWSYTGCPTYGKGMNTEERIQKAVDILKQAGYSWESES